MPSWRVLVIDSEPKDARDERHRHGRPTACESFIAALKKIEPELVCGRAAPVDGIAAPPAFRDYRAAFFAGSPLHFYEDRDDVKRVLAFSRDLLGSGIPCFGSCAGLQIATIVAGGKVRPKDRQTELGIARGIYATADGKNHPLLHGRPLTFDAPSIHGDEVKELPDGATLLAASSKTWVQAVEMRVDRSLFWGTQYHPEISLGEIALALRDQADDAVKQGFARNRSQLDVQLAKFSALDGDPQRHDLAWEVGLDRQTTQFLERTTEMRNFMAAFVTTG